VSDLSEAIETALDTDPLLLRDALEAVLVICDRFDNGIVGGSNEQARFVADQYRREIARALGVTSRHGDPLSDQGKDGPPA
jgi:hypothetical protein